MSTLELDEIEGETALDASGLAVDDQAQVGGDEAASDVAPEAAEGEALPDADEVVITIGDESDQAGNEDQPPPGLSAKANAAWFQQRRKRNELKSELREAKAELERLRSGQATTAPAAVGEKPTLEACDFDPEKYASEFEAWHARKAEADQQARQRAQAEEQNRAQWTARIDAVKTAASTLRVGDYEDAAQTFEDTFSLVQQGIVIGGPDDPKMAAMLRYALGKNPGKAKQLASITDPVKFAFAIANLGTQLKVTDRKLAPPPDRQIRSGVSGAAALGNAQLEKLKEAAQKSGDYTAYFEARRKLKG